jgi:polysaccharide deacetylase 2 family uncharacterized protein YibQ
MVKFLNKLLKNPAAATKNNAANPKMLVDETLGIATMQNQSEVKNKPGLRDKIKVFFARRVEKYLKIIRLWIHGTLAFSGIAACLIMGYFSIETSTVQSIHDGNSLMLNLITQEIFVGSLYKNPTALQKDGVESPPEPFSNLKLEPESESPSFTRRNFRATAKQIGAQDNRYKIAVVITELGLNNRQTEEVLKLPSDINLAFSPYSPDLTKWADKALAQHFEVFLHLPMQPAEYMFDDPGPYSLLSKASVEQNTQRLEQLIALSHKFVGFITKSTEIFSTNQMNMRPILKLLQENDLMLLYSNVRNFGVMGHMCKEMKAECLFTEFIIDEEVESDNIYRALRKAEVDAKKNGAAIVYINSYPHTLETFKRWVDGLDIEQYILVPASALLAVQ